MNIAELEDMVVGLYAVRTPMMVLGAPGIGKSACIRAAASRLAGRIGIERVVEMADDGGPGDFGVYDVRLSQCDPVDIGGLPYEDKTIGAMGRLPPSWWPHEGRDDTPDHGILLLDELPSAPLSVQTAAYQIVLDRVIGGHRLKSGWYIVAAGNRVTDGGQHFRMPPALANRMCHVDVESSVDSWIDWAVRAGVMADVISFIRFRPSLLNTFSDWSATRKGLAFATERQWAAVSDVMKHIDVLTSVGCNVVRGLVGDGPAAEFSAFRRLASSMPDIDAILSGDAELRVPDEVAVQYAVAGALASRATVDNMPRVVRCLEKFQAKGRSEYAVMCIKDIQRRHAGTPDSPLKTEAFLCWARHNAGLFSLEV